MKLCCALRTRAQVPAGDEWLPSTERAAAARLLVAKRRADFRLGRFAAHAALEHAQPAALNAGERPAIVAAADGAPEAYLHGAPLPLCLSISHRAELGACAVADQPIGCDLEVVEPRSPELIADFFTALEAARLQVLGPGARMVATALTWSAKESLLKLLRAGLRRDTRSVELVELALDGDGDQWRPLRLRDLGSGRGYHGLWRRRGDLVLTLVGESPLPEVDLV